MGAQALPGVHAAPAAAAPADDAEEDEWSMLQREVQLLSGSLPGSKQPSMGGAPG